MIQDNKSSHLFYYKLSVTNTPSKYKFLFITDDNKIVSK